MIFDESVAEAWRARYGAEPPPAIPDEFARFLAHRSVRKFTDEAIPESTMAGLIGVAQSASTSSSLQLWGVVSVQDPEVREEIALASDDQDQIRQAAWFLVFLADHYRLARAARKHGQDPNALPYTEFLLMAAIDAALAAERLTCAAEAIGLGVCYIGAIRNDPYRIAELLDLPEGTAGMFGLCLGRPLPEGKEAIKPRLGQASVWMRERYDREVEVEEYLPRMSAFYESQGAKGAIHWAMRSGRRVNEASLTGREVMKAFLEERGFGLK